MTDLVIEAKAIFGLAHSVERLERLARIYQSKIEQVRCRTDVTVCHRLVEVWLLYVSREMFVILDENKLKGRELKHFITDEIELFRRFGKSTT